MESFSVQWIEGDMLGDLSTQLDMHQAKNQSHRLVCVMQCHRNPGAQQCYRAVWASPADIVQPKEKP